MVAVDPTMQVVQEVLPKTATDQQAPAPISEEAGTAMVVVEVGQASKVAAVAV